MIIQLAGIVLELPRIPGEHMRNINETIKVSRFYIAFENLSFWFAHPSEKARVSFQQ